MDDREAVSSRSEGRVALRPPCSERERDTGRGRGRFFFYCSGTGTFIIEL